MKNVNELVMNVQAEGTESYSFVELFETISRQTIEPKAESFRRQLKGQVEEAVSEGYKLLMELVESWNGTGNFHTLYKTAFSNRLKNLVKYVNRDKRKHETNYDLSLSESVERDGEASPVLEVASATELQTHIDFIESFSEVPSLENLVKQFAVTNPEQAGVIELMMNFSDDMKQKDKTNAYCEYFCVQSYTSAIQKKVSRSREAFKKYLIKNNYQGMAV